MSVACGKHSKFVAIIIILTTNSYMLFQKNKLFGWPNIQHQCQQPFFLTEISKFHIISFAEIPQKALEYRLTLRLSQKIKYAPSFNFQSFIKSDNIVCSLSLKIYSLQTEFTITSSFITSLHSLISTKSQGKPCKIFIYKSHFPAKS